MNAIAGVTRLMSLRRIIAAPIIDQSSNMRAALISKKVSPYGPLYCNTLQNRLCSSQPGEEEDAVAADDLPPPQGKRKYPEWDRRVRIRPEVSIRYMESEAYQQTYQGYPVWKLFRRRRPGQIMPEKTRLSCILDDGFLKSGNPCPVCRDEYLVLDYRNVKLLEQFINPLTGEAYACHVVNLCQMRYEELQVALLKARQYGTMAFPVAFRKYNYEEYYGPRGKIITDIDVPKPTTSLDEHS